MAPVNEDRVFRMCRAQKRGRAMEGWNVRGAVYDIARQFDIPCSKVRAILAARREGTSRK